MRKKYTDNECITSSRSKAINMYEHTPSHQGWFLLNPHLHQDFVSPFSKSRTVYGPYCQIKKNYIKFIYVLFTFKFGVMCNHT